MKLSEECFYFETFFSSTNFYWLIKGSIFWTHSLEAKLHSEFLGTSSVLSSTPNWQTTPKYRFPGIFAFIFDSSLGLLANSQKFLFIKKKNVILEFRFLQVFFWIGITIYFVIPQWNRFPSCATFGQQTIPQFYPLPVMKERIEVRIPEMQNTLSAISSKSIFFAQSTRTLSLILHAYKGSKRDNTAERCWFKVCFFTFLVLRSIHSKVVFSLSCKNLVLALSALCICSILVNVFYWTILRTLLNLDQPNIRIYTVRIGSVEVRSFIWRSV